MTRALLIQKLLETYHLNVPERRQLVPPALEVSELQAVIRDCVEGVGRFSQLEKLEGGTYRVHHCEQPEYAMGCYGPPIDVIDDYADLDSAAQELLNSAYHLGRLDNIDGIEISGLAQFRALPPPTTLSQEIHSLLGERSQTESDHKIIPGNRVGALQLAGKIDEVETLFGPSAPA